VITLVSMFCCMLTGDVHTGSDSCLRLEMLRGNDDIRELQVPSMMVSCYTSSLTGQRLEPHGSGEHGVCVRSTALWLWWQVDQLNGKLAELEEEREELAEYQRLDKQRRALEFAIYDRDLSSTKAALQEVTTDGWTGEALKTRHGCLGQWSLIHSGYDQ